MAPPEKFASSDLNRSYWDQLAEQYQSETRISTRDFHFGPLLPGDKELGLLPTEFKGRTCLELGCGAAQNSIYLASRGAQCTALDISPRQLAFATSLAEQNEVSIQFVAGGLDELESQSLGTFDLIHSSYALPFADDPGRVVQWVADHLSPGGTLLLTMGHPLFSGEFIELDENERGLFLTDYFYPLNDTRVIEESDALTVARYYPISEMTDWVLHAGLRIESLREPRPLPIPTLGEEEILNRVPYDSPEWREHFDALDSVPVVFVIKATKS